MKNSMYSLDEIDHTAQFVSCDPPYQDFYVKRKGNANHEHLRGDDIDVFMVCMTFFMKRGLHMDVFSTTVHFWHWLKD